MEGAYRCEEWSDEDHEDIVEEQEYHQNSYHPHSEEFQAHEHYCNEGKSKDILEYPSIHSMPLHCPPHHNTHTEHQHHEELWVRTAKKNGNLVLGQPEKEGVRAKLSPMSSSHQSSKLAA